MMSQDLNSLLWSVNCEVSSGREVAELADVP